MKVINIFAGPGCGKSTLSTEVFSALKKMHLKVEYVGEYAKDLIYEKRFEKLNDYLYVFAEQHHRIHRLKNDIDYVICDGSFLLGNLHFNNDCIYNEKLFKSLVLETFNEYDNHNYFLKRGNTPYQSYGRKESFKDAKKMDKKLKKLLKNYEINFKIINNKKGLKTIIKDLAI